MNPNALASSALTALDLVEAVSRRKVGPLVAWLEKRMQTSFQLQGREFLKRFAKKQGKWPLKEADTTPLSQFQDDLDETIEAAAAEIAANLEIAVTKGLIQGGASLLSQMGGSGGGSGRAMTSLAIRFDLRSPRAIAYLKNYGARQVTGVSETTKTRIRNLLVQGLEERWSYAEMANQIKARFKQMAFGVPQHHIRSRAELIAATECFPASTAITLMPFSDHPHFGSVFGSNLGRVKLLSGIRGATRRWYEGRFIEITTASGNKLSGTPNHPIMTSSGWVALGSLAKGDNVFSSGDAHRACFRDPNVNDTPTSIGELFDALKCDGATERRVGSLVDFHGDGADGEVEVVWSASELRGDYKAALAKDSPKPVLATSDLYAARLSGSGLSLNAAGGLANPFGKSGNLAHSSLERGVHLFQLYGSLLGTKLGPLPDARLAHGSDVAAALTENSPDTVIADAVLYRESLTGLTGDVFLDEIISVDQSKFAGHVYNLITVNGEYAANGIIASNCGNAFEEGSMVAALELEAAGRIMQKRWLTVGDVYVDGNCQANEAMGWVVLNETYANGEDRPLDHPACRCSLAYRAVRNLTPSKPTVH